jgi:hypothetical protein
MIFTLFTQAILSIVEFSFKLLGNYWSIAKWSNSSSLIWSIVIALLMGFIFSYFANNDKLHKLLRELKITREGSYPTEWFKSFLNVTYIVLHLHDGRRLYGWPSEWPSVPTVGHFLIFRPAWLVDNGENKLIQQPIDGIENILIDVKDVKWVEFIEKTWENENG